MSGSVAGDSDVEAAAERDILDTGEAGGRAIRGGAAVSASYVAGLVISLASVPFVIRHLGVVDYGHYITVSALVMIIGGVTEAGLTNLGVREYAVRSPAEREPFLRSLVGLRLVLTGIGVAAAVAISAATGAPDVVVAGSAIAGLGLVVQLTQQTYMVPLQAQLRLGAVAVLGVVKQLTLSGLFIALVILGAGLVWFFWASVAMGLVVVAATLALLRGTAPLLPGFRLDLWKRILRETLPYAVAAAVGLIYFRIGVVLMSYVSTEVETGFFSAAFRIVEVLATLPWLLVSAAFPILARAADVDDDERFRYGLQRVFEVSTLAGAFLALGLAVAAPFAIDVVAGAGFEEAVPVLRIQALGLLTAFLMATWTFALLSLKLFRLLMLANGAAALAAIAGTLALAPALGAEGTAIATVAAEAVLAVACLLALRRGRPGLRLGYGILPRTAAAAAPAVVLVLVVPAHPLVLAILGGAVFVAMAFALGAVPPEAIAAVRRRTAPAS